jgi:anti-sigma B factor antagonist
VAFTDQTIRRSSERETLTLSVSEDQTTCSIGLSGELDLATVPDLEREIDRAAATAATRIVLDLRGLEFIDSAGLRVLIESARRAELNGGRLRLLRGSGQVEQVMSLCRLHERLPFAD